jgi:TolB-like protein
VHVTCHRYYVRVFVNGHLVDTSSDVHLDEDFKASFKDIFSVQVSSTGVHVVWSRPSICMRRVP